jgi:hypothetical protein
MSGSSKPGRFKRWVLAVCLAASFSFAAPSLSRAASSSDDSTPDHDARLDGYAQNMVLDAGGTASTYVILVIMGVLCLGVMFIKGKRTHLD